MKILKNSSGVTMLEALIASCLLGFILLSSIFFLKTTFLNIRRVSQNDEATQLQSNIRTILTNPQACKNTLGALDYNNNVEAELVIKDDSGQRLWGKDDVVGGVQITGIKARPGTNSGNGIYLSSVSIEMERFNQQRNKVILPITLYINAVTTTVASGIIQRCIFSATASTEILPKDSGVQVPIDTTRDSSGDYVYKSLALCRAGHCPSSLSTKVLPLDDTTLSSPCYKRFECEGTSCNTGGTTGYVDCPYFTGPYSLPILAKGNIWIVTAYVGMASTPKQYVGVLELFLHDNTSNTSMSVGRIGQTRNNDVTLTMPSSVIDSIVIGHSYSFYFKNTLKTSEQVALQTLPAPGAVNSNNELLFVDYQQYWKH